MSQDISRLLNQIPDLGTRHALRKIFEQLKADLEANKAAFDNHVHNYDSSTSATDQLTSKPDTDENAPDGTVTVNSETKFQNNIE